MTRQVLFQYSVVSAHISLSEFWRDNIVQIQRLVKVFYVVRHEMKASIFHDIIREGYATADFFHIFFAGILETW